MAEKRDRRPRNEEQRDLMDDDVKDVSEENDDRFGDVENEDEDSDQDAPDEEASGGDAGVHG